MKIQCTCGRVIPDADDSPSKAQIIPDQEWSGIWDAIDAAIERPWRNDKDREAACMSLRTKIISASRQAWQCNACGRIYMDDQTFKLQAFAPDSAEAPREIFRSRPSSQ
jgi:hypothetical protein